MTVTGHRKRATVVQDNFSATSLSPMRKGILEAAAQNLIQSWRWLTKQNETLPVQKSWLYAPAQLREYSQPQNFIIGWVKISRVTLIYRSAWDWESQWEWEFHGNPMGMRQELHKTWEWEWESTSMGIGMTPYSHGNWFPSTAVVNCYRNSNTRPIQ